jgi:hypothetical protein
MRAAGGADPGPLLYHDSGPIMHRLKIYEIFWSPDTLQTGDSTGFSPNYFEVQTKLGNLYNGHGIRNNNTQYFQTINGKTTYVRNQGDLAGVVVDTSPYPVSGCNDAFTPGNCITDAQIRTEILKVIRQERWKVGLDSIFLLYTSSGEGSCFDQSGNTCAYSSYCHTTALFRQAQANGKTPLSTVTNHTATLPSVRFLVYRRQTMTLMPTPHRLRQVMKSQKPRLIRCLTRGSQRKATRLAICAPTTMVSTLGKVV